MASSTIIDIASDLTEEVENRYALVLEVADIAKRLLDDARERIQNDPFASETTTSSEKVIYQALIMKASEIDIGDGLIG
jgi:hypothetical protein